MVQNDKMGAGRLFSKRNHGSLWKSRFGGEKS